MRKILLRVAKIVGALVVLAVLGLVVKFFVLSPKSRPAPDVKAATSPEAIERGKYLVDHVAACLVCHSTVDESQPGDHILSLGAGRDFGDLPGFPGRLRSPNLSPDKETGIGSYTDGEVLRAMREGVGKDGHALFPQMPFLTYAETLSDDDALAIIGYLRTIPAVKNDPGKMVVSFPVSMFIRAVPQPLTSGAPPAPASTDKMARGKWLLQVGSCGECHDGVDNHRQKIPGEAMAGGQEFPMPNGRGTAIAPNITSDPATGIGAYSDDDIRRAIDDGKLKNGKTINVMPWSYYAGMTKDDKDALIAALRAVPPVQKRVAASKTP